MNMHPCLVSQSAPTGHTVSPCAICVLKNFSFVDTSVNSFDDGFWWQTLISPSSFANGAACTHAGARMKTEIEISAKSVYDGISAVILVCDGKELAEVERVRAFVLKRTMFLLIEWKAIRRGYVALTDTNRRSVRVST